MRVATSISPSTSGLAAIARASTSRRPARDRRATGRVTSVRASSSSETERAEKALEAPWVAPGYRGAFVSTLEPKAQGAVVLAIWSAIAIGTYECVSEIGPALERAAPGAMAWSKSTWPVIGATYVAAGWAHFQFRDGFESMMPHRGCWGFWNVPGSKRFHVEWTGAAEILGGAGLMLGSLPFGLTPNWLSEWLTPVSAISLFALTCVVTPANTYMFTHNAPGPLPPNADDSMRTLPLQGHLARALLQVFLLSLLHGCAER